MLGLWRVSGGAGTGLDLDQYAPNNAALLVSDVRSVAVRDATTLRFERPIVGASGYRNAAPGARVTFQTDATILRLDLFWNALMTRADTFQSVGSVLVNGVEVATFQSPFAYNVTGLDRPVFALAAGSKTVTIVWPYSAGLELRGVGINPLASLSAPAARPTALLAACGDSITHGFTVGKTTESWAFKLAAAEGRQLFNLANGSETAVAANATTALTGTGAQVVTYMIGYNNFVAQTPLATFQAAVEGWITNARAALPSAAIHIITPIYSPNTNTITLAQYRTAVTSAEAAAGDANTYLIDGLSIMTNSADRLADGVHPNALGSDEIATALGALI